MPRGNDGTLWWVGGGLAEVIATLGSAALIFDLARTDRLRVAPAAVDA
jgi:hypothetical protein